MFLLTSLIMSSKFSSHIPVINIKYLMTHLYVHNYKLILKTLMWELREYFSLFIIVMFQDSFIKDYEDKF